MGNPSTNQVVDVDTALDIVQNNNIAQWPTFNQHTNPDSNPELVTQDHFVRRNGIVFAGTHLIFDFWGACQLDNLELMESALRESVEVAGATLLHIHLHHFTPNGGISGVAVLAESHISVHTWPERGYAAFDVFMCGDAEPEKTIPVLKKAFRPDQVNMTEHLRGMVDEENV
ncbi:MAG: adenosylmethionine decarboxylase [Gammaproteobacteria bacterium]|nr:adenosylmethionine decarboxylase [Gammaproteobacteria bacterium]MCW8986211.1 adenosylmethionine decarboxylase [Gammaproteobacteria bacterium]MCW9031927.1 adenosylmethionine decarboxylase [Gammaproteobacteria bacterium]